MHHIFTHCAALQWNNLHSSRSNAVRTGRAVLGWNRTVDVRRHQIDEEWDFITVQSVLHVGSLVWPRVEWHLKRWRTPKIGMNSLALHWSRQLISSGNMQYSSYGVTQRRDLGVMQHGQSHRQLEVVLGRLDRERAKWRLGVDFMRLLKEGDGDPQRSTRMLK